MKVVFLDIDTFPKDYHFEKLDFPHEWITYPYTNSQDTLERCTGAQVIITNKTLLNREILFALKDTLKLIQITATGTNNVDLEAAKEFNIQVNNVAGYSSNSVAEHVIAYIFALSKALPGYTHDAIKAKWPKSATFTYHDYANLDIQGKTLGILGKGNIGTALGEKAKSLGMNVIYAERKGATKIREGYTSFDEVLANADYLSLNYPYTPETFEIINAQSLVKMKKTAFLINAGRGQLVNEVDLAQALKNGDIKGAALDVLQTEPPSINNELIKLAQEHPYLIITPHIAWTGEDALRVLADTVIAKINLFY